jgi:hypothetical protein
MTRFPLSIGIFLPLLICGLWVHALYAQQADGPFGLRWGMTQKDVENMDIRLCCAQLGKWGMRYEVNPQDFKNFPKRLGDEEKIYLYFGNRNTLFRMYVSTTKIGAQNRYNQIKILLAEKYNLVKDCEAKRQNLCGEYKAYAEYKANEVTVFVAFEENLTYRDKIFITLLHNELYKTDKNTKNPF